MNVMTLTDKEYIGYSVLIDGRIGALRLVLFFNLKFVNACTFMSQNLADKPPAGWWSAPGAQRAGRAGSSQGSGFKAPPPWEVRSHRRGRRLAAKKTVERHW